MRSLSSTLSLIPPHSVRLLIISFASLPPSSQPFPLAGVLTLSLCTNMVVATPYRLAAPVAKAENDPAFGANEGLQRVRTAVGEVLEKEEVANHQEVRPVFPCLLVLPRQLPFLPLTLMFASISAGLLPSLSSPSSPSLASLAAFAFSFPFPRACLVVRKRSSTSPPAEPTTCARWSSALSSVSLARTRRSMGTSCCGTRRPEEETHAYG